MEIRITPENEIHYLEVSGRLDAANASILEERLNGLIAQGSMKMLICLEQVDYISSSGLRAFLAVAKKIGQQGFIRFCCLQPNVREVFSISGFNTIFSIFESKEDALS